MKLEDVKIGMKVHFPKSKKFTGVYTVSSIPQYKCGEYWIKVVDDNSIVHELICQFAEPYIKPKVEQPEFTWDKSVPTCGVPFKLTNGKWYIGVDGSKSAMFQTPIEVHDVTTRLLDSYKLCAIVSNSTIRFIFNEGYGIDNGCLILPVTHTPKVKEMTVNEIEEKLGHKIKIISEENK